MLLTLTLVTVGLVVLVLAGFLIAIAWALLQAKRSVASIADGLEAVAEHAGPLTPNLVNVNRDLGSLLQGLNSADLHLARAANAFRIR